MKARKGQRRVGKDGFLFLANHPALDFLNTRPVQDGAAMELLPNFGALLRWFVAAGLLPIKEAARLQRRWEGSARAARVVQGVCELRERLRKDVIAWEDGGVMRSSTLRQLNRLLALYPVRARLHWAASKLQRGEWFDVQVPEALYAPLVNAAASLFTAVDGSRVRMCGSCVLHFLDTSKKGTRRWCSMQLCGNRRKVAAYAARQRHASEK